MSAQPDLSTLPQRMRYAADVLGEASNRDFDGDSPAYTWHPDVLRSRADKWEAEDANRAVLVEELAQDLKEHYFDRNLAGSDDVYWRQRAGRLIESGWRKGDPA